MDVSHLNLDGAWKRAIKKSGLLYEFKSYGPIAYLERQYNRWLREVSDRPGTDDVSEVQKVVEESQEWFQKLRDMIAKVREHYTDRKCANCWYFCSKRSRCGKREGAEPLIEVEEVDWCCQWVPDNFGQKWSEQPAILEGVEE